MINRVQILLIQPEYNALLEMSNNDMRSIPDEIHFVLKEEIKRRGLLDTGSDPNIPVLEKLNNGQ